MGRTTPARYFFHSNLQYVDYLQAKEFSTEINNNLVSIYENTKPLVGVNETLHRIGADVGVGLGKVDESVTAGMSEISRELNGLQNNLGAVSIALDRIDETLHWGFSEVLTSIGAMQDSIEDIVKLVKSPEATWACEQFENAKEAFRKKLYPEAVEYVTYSIKGDGRAHSGHKLEWRFHFFLGTLRIGSFDNCSTYVVDLGEAESSFLLAARYAVDDYPKEASKALLAAGWAAYCKKDLPSAEAHTTLAIKIQPNDLESRFQLAKILAANKEYDRAFGTLESIAEINPMYWGKALVDGDFLDSGSEFEHFLQGIRTAKINRLGNIVEIAKRISNYSADIDRHKTELGIFGWVQSTFQEWTSRMSTASVIAQGGGIVDLALVDSSYLALIAAYMEPMYIAVKEAILPANIASYDEYPFTLEISGITESPQVNRALETLTDASKGNKGLTSREVLLKHQESAQYLPDAARLIVKLQTARINDAAKKRIEEQEREALERKNAEVRRKIFGTIMGGIGMPATILIIAFYSEIHSAMWQTIENANSFWWNYDTGLTLPWNTLLQILNLGEGLGSSVLKLLLGIAYIMFVFPFWLPLWLITGCLISISLIAVFLHFLPASFLLLALLMVYSAAKMASRKK